jgi:hypothetical protein
MKFDRIDAFSPGVEGMQHRCMAIGKPRVLEVLGGAEHRPGAIKLRRRLASPFAPHRLLQSAVAAEEVVVRQRWGLVEDRAGA